MTLSRRLLIVFLALIALAEPASADWTVTRVAPEARYAADGQTWRPLTLGTQVPDDAWIHAGRRGRVLLRRNGEIIQFKPNTTGAIATRIEGGVERTSILRKFGSILLDAAPAPRSGSAADAPFLAAIVKGAFVAVDVGAGPTDVRRGVGSERVEPVGGQRVRVRAAGDKSVRVLGRGPKAPVQTMAPRMARLRPADAAGPSRAADAGDDRASTTAACRGHRAGRGGAARPGWPGTTPGPARPTAPPAGGCRTPTRGSAAAQGAAAKAPAAVELWMPAVVALPSARSPGDR